MKLKLFVGLFLFLLFPQVAFAAVATNIEVTGLILDQASNPIPQGYVVFTDATGKEVNAATSDTSGLYRTEISQGSYTIAANGPTGENFTSSTVQRKITSPTTINFTLNAPKNSAAVVEKKTGNELFIALFVIAIIFIAGLISYLYLKRKKSPQSGSSD